VNWSSVGVKSLDSIQAKFEQIADLPSEWADMVDSELDLHHYGSQTPNIIFS